MESGVSAGLALGAEAAVKLNELLRDTDTAKAWYGDYYDLFTAQSLCFWYRRRVSRVFVVDKTDWKAVIGRCLDDCHRWVPNGDGECSWLHIYRAISENRQKHTKMRRFSSQRDVPYTEKTSSSLSYLGSISSLPAANLDSWGLIVLALANGAKVNYTSTERGGFAASLEARNFIITIQRHNIVTQMTGHLEPRDHPEQERRVLSDTKWNNLLWYGHTYDTDDPIMSWIRVDEEGGPPEELVNRRRDAEFQNTVIDHPTRQVLADKLRDAIHKCHKAWEDYERKMRLHMLFYYNKDKDEIEKIKENLKKKKVILCDERGTDYALEQTPADTLEYAMLQLDRTRDYYFKNNEKAELVRLQKKIYVLTQFLVLPQILDKPISTKGRGITVALA